MTDQLRRQIERRVQASIDREVSKLETQTETLRSRHVAAEAALEAARDHEQETWKRHDRTRRRRHYYAWQNAMTERDRAEDELRSVLFELRRAGHLHDALTDGTEYRRRVRQAERNADLREEATA